MGELTDEQKKLTIRYIVLSGFIGISGFLIGTSLARNHLFEEGVLITVGSILLLLLDYIMFQMIFN